VGADIAGVGAGVAAGANITAVGADDTAAGGDITAVGADDAAIGGDITVVGADDIAAGGGDITAVGTGATVSAFTAGNIPTHAKTINTFPIPLIMHSVIRS